MGEGAKFRSTDAGVNGAGRSRLSGIGETSYASVGRGTSHAHARRRGAAAGGGRRTPRGFADGASQALVYSFLPQSLSDSGCDGSFLWIEPTAGVRAHRSTFASLTNGPGRGVADAAWAGVEGSDGAFAGNQRGVD